MLDGALEDNVLTAICWSDSHASQIAQQVSAELFSTRPYQKIAEAALDHLQRYGKPAGIHLRDLLERELTRGEQGLFLRQVIDSMDQLHENLQIQKVMDDLELFIRKQLLLQAVEGASDALQAGDIGAAENLLYSPDLRPRDDRPGVWLTDTDAWLEFLDEHEEDYFSIGIPTLDDRGIRPGRGEMFLFIAPAKRGKSFFLQQVGTKGVFDGKKVLHISLENDLRIVTSRYTMSFLSMSTEPSRTMQVPMIRRDQQGKFLGVELVTRVPQQVTSISRGEIVKRLAPFQKRGKLMLKWFPMGTLTMSGLNMYLDSLARGPNGGFVPDIVLLDYADLMYIDENNLRISTGRLFRDLRGLAGMRNFALVTATQGNRGSDTAKLVVGGHVAEDWSKIGTADTVVTYSQTQSEKEQDVARLFVAAARKATDKWLAFITQSYQTGQFCLDSEYFHADMRKELARMTGDDYGEEKT